MGLADETKPERHLWFATHCGVNIEVIAEGKSSRTPPQSFDAPCVGCGQMITLVKHEPVDVTLSIDNVYEDGEEIRTVVETTVPAPPFPPYSYAYEGDDWELDHIMPHTGTGRTDGDAAYFVEVTTSSRPDLLPVGSKFEFGT